MRVLVIISCFLLSYDSSLLAGDRSAMAWLDRPLEVDANWDPHEVVAKLCETLPDEDRFFLEQAFSAISVEFLVREGYAGVPLVERSSALSDFIDGLTPRKIILSGLMLRARQHNERDRLGEAGIADRSRQLHLIEAAKAEDDMVVMALERYGKEGRKKEG